MQALYAQSRMASLSQSRISGTFASLKKIAFDFSQSRLWRDRIRLRRTPFAITGDHLKLQVLFALKLNLDVYSDRLQVFLSLTLMSLSREE